MTLILTEISEFGIAMAADTAVTFELPLPNGDRISRVLTGVKKLQPIPKLQAGISIWGTGEIERTDSDIWLARFIEANQNNYDSLSDFAILLQNELRRHIRKINIQKYPWGTIGFHLAGFVESNAEKLPVFYHIHNGRSQVLEARGLQIDPRKINANLDFPPQRIPQGQVYIWRNGDFQMYAQLFDVLGTFFQDLARRTRIAIPYATSLGDRAEWLKFQIQTMAHLYRLGKLLPVIGGEITTLTISPDGITSYEIHLRY